MVDAAEQALALLFPSARQSRVQPFARLARTGAMAPASQETTVPRIDTAREGGAAGAVVGHLAVLHGQAEAALPLDGPEHVLGRTELGDTTGCSRRHCRLVRAVHGYDVEDLESRNGTYVDGSPVVPGRRVPLVDGQLLRVGDTLLVYRAEPAPDPAPFDHPILPGRSPGVRRARELLQPLAPLDAAVLVVGETGTGKEFVARGLHSESARAARPMVTVNCGGLTGNLIVSKLFGTTKGAFTGATATDGLVAHARDGTLFLDELTELPIDDQPALLRLLQDGTYRAVGSNVELRSRARFVAATNRDLDTAVAERRLRPDLRGRLHTVELPPLRARREDLLEWARRFALPWAPRWTAGFAEVLLLQPWPLNLRELEQVMRTLRLSRPDSEVLRAADLPDAMTALRTRARQRRLDPPTLASAPAPAPDASPRASTLTPPAELGPLDRASWKVLVDALHRHRGVIAKVADEVGLTRQALYRKLERLGLDATDFRDAP